MSAYKIHTPGNYPEESIQHSEHGENLKSRILDIFSSAQFELEKKKHQYSRPIVSTANLAGALLKLRVNIPSTLRFRWEPFWHTNHPTHSLSLVKIQNTKTNKYNPKEKYKPKQINPVFPSNFTNILIYRIKRTFKQGTKVKLRISIKVHKVL